MRQYIIVFILMLSSISGFSQTPKGYYFMDIKGTAWLSSGNIVDSAILDAAEMSLSIHKLSVIDTLSKNVWIFADSLTIKFYDATSKIYKTILTCKYHNNESEKILLLQLNNGREIKFEYVPVSTGSFIYLYKKNKKK